MPTDLILFIIRCSKYSSFTDMMHHLVISFFFSILEIISRYSPRGVGWGSSCDKFREKLPICVQECDLQVEGKSLFLFHHHHAGLPPQCSGGWFRAGFIKDAKDHIVHPAVKNIVKLQPERSRCLETEKEWCPTQAVTEPNASTPNLI